VTATEFNALKGALLPELQEHLRLLSHHSAQLDRQENTLEGITSAQREHSVVLHEHSAILQEHSAILNEHSVILREHSALLRDHGERLAGLKLGRKASSALWTRVSGCCPTVWTRFSAGSPIVSATYPIESANLRCRSATISNCETG
jgi:hypothetical protein